MPEYGATTTTDEVLEGLDLTGRRVLVTGASSGLGEEATRALASAGATVTMLARDPAKLDAAASRVREQVPDADLKTGLVDLADLSSIRSFASGYLEGGEVIDVLINNAGVMASPETKTADGLELQFGTNHIGHFLLTNLLMPAILAGEDPRIVNLSSAGHALSDVDLDDPNFERTTYDPWVSYGRSKTANILFTRELAGRLNGEVLVFAVHPGVIVTELIRHLPEEVLEQSADQFRDRMKTVEAGAATEVWAATAPELADHSGSYLADCQLGVMGGETEKTGFLEYAYDQDNARGLWTLSEELVGEEFDPPR